LLPETDPRGQACAATSIESSCVEDPGAQVLELDAELAQFQECGLRQRVVSGQNGSGEVHPVLFPERLAVAENVVVARR
jgi:hypothetical protein